MIPPSTTSSINYPSTLLFQNEINNSQHMPGYNIQQQPLFQYQQYSQNNITPNEDDIINTINTTERSLPPLSHLLSDKTKVKAGGTYDSNTTPISQGRTQLSSSDLDVTVDHASSSIPNQYCKNMSNGMQQTYSHRNSVMDITEVNPYIVESTRENNEKYQQQKQQIYTPGLMSPGNTYTINNKNRFTTSPILTSDRFGQHELHINKSITQSPVVSNDISFHMNNPYTSSSVSYYDNMNSQATSKLTGDKYQYSSYVLPPPPLTTLMGNTSLPLTDNNSNSNNNSAWTDCNIQDTSSNSQAYEDYQKVYSFVPLSGSVQRKRPRRKFHEVERLYHCNFLNCTKAYGTLNHLNAHITMQEHGPKRLPGEFKELRKHLRKLKSEQQKKDKMEEYLERFEIYDRNLYS